jgi:hypothetical protein
MKTNILAIVLCMLFGISGILFAGGVSETIDSNGTWAGGTAGFPAVKGSQVNISINPLTSPVMTITLQKKLPGDSAWGEHIVDTWDLTADSTDLEYVIPNGGTEPEDCLYRIGCDSVSDYTSGDCSCRIGGGR